MLLEEEGEVLRALEHLLQRAASRPGVRQRVVVTCPGYREQRDDALRAGGPGPGPGRAGRRAAPRDPAASTPTSGGSSTSRSPRSPACAPSAWARARTGGSRSRPRSRRRRAERGVRPPAGAGGGRGSSRRPSTPLARYLDLLAAWSARVNLTAARTPARRVEVLVAPALAARPLLGPGSSWTWAPATAPPAWCWPSWTPRAPSPCWSRARGAGRSCGRRPGAPDARTCGSSASATTATRARPRPT